MNGLPLAIGAVGAISLFTIPSLAGSADRHRAATLPRLATLFSGGGLVEVGLEGLATPTFAVDNNPEVANAYAAAHGAHVVTGDVRNVQLPSPGAVDVLHASPVCKTFSRAKRRDTEAVRQQISTGTDVDIATARATANAIHRLRPMVFTLENVPDYVGSTALGLIERALEEEGYTMDARVYEAADYGAPTRRKRLLLRAVREGNLPPAPAPLRERADWFEAVRDILDTMPDSMMAPWMRERLALVKINPDTITRPLLVMGGSAGKNVPYAWAGGPAPTVKATHKEAHKIILPDGRVKRLTPRGMARIMGLPDSYPLPKDVRVATMVVGNGVPPALARAVFGPLMHEPLMARLGRSG